MAVDLRSHFERLYPGSRIASIEPLGPDSGATAATAKVAGYGVPIRVSLVDADGQRRDVVWRTASANEFGHDRRSDRVAGIVQSYADFAATPGHIAALDLGFVGGDGTLHSVRETGEPYLVTSFAPGSIYAADLRRIAAERSVSALDLARLDALVRYLVELHVAIPDGATRYRRAIRDLVGSGEGVYGIIDGYPDELASVRLHSIEEQCAEWRWRLRGRHHRLARTHGDFHPFNIVFDGAKPTMLDASRGGCGDPADDLTAMAVNFLLFAIDDPPAWHHGLGVLWRRWWATYLSLRDDGGLLDVAPPFFAWRVLVVCNPRFYPNLSATGRDKLLGFAEDMLAAHTLDLTSAEDLF